MTVVKALKCLVMVALTAAAARAGGFEVQGMSARGAGMGGVMAMVTGNPTSAYLNPASLTYLRGTQFSIGTTVTLPDFRFAEEGGGGASTKMQTQVLFPPNLCLTHTFSSGLGFGIAATIPYSSKTDWGVEWVGRNVIAASELRGVVVTPMVSFRATRSVSVGIGVNITSFRFVRSSRVAIAGGTMVPLEGTERLQGDASMAYGLQVGMQVVPDDVFSFGFVYKSRSAVNVENGEVLYEWPSGHAPAAGSPAGTFATAFTLPDRIHAGVSFQPITPLLLVGELEYVRWSSIGRQVVTVNNSPVTSEIVAQQDWKDVLAAHAGVELSFGDVALRAGFMIDRSPISDAQLRPSIPDADRAAYTAGIGYAIGEGLDLDVALQIVEYSDRTITNSAITSAAGLPLNGTYKMSATVVGLNVSYSWK
jgi:long-chain fatty acid transport protein